MSNKNQLYLELVAVGRDGVGGRAEWSSLDRAWGYIDRTSLPASRAAACPRWSACLTARVS
jgi:hypothetical protein